MTSPLLTPPLSLLTSSRSLLVSTSPWLSLVMGAMSSSLVTSVLWLLAWPRDTVVYRCSYGLRWLHSPTTYQSPPDTIALSVGYAALSRMHHSLWLNATVAGSLSSTTASAVNC